MRRPLLAASLLVVILPAAGEAQARRAGTRLVAVRAEPARPSLGDVFTLHLTLRIPAGTIAFLPDTLQPAPSIQSVKPGTWRTQSAPGDSLDIAAAYPVIAFRDGRSVLPAIEVRVRPVAGDTAAGARRAADAGAPTARETSRVVRLGSLDVSPLVAMAESTTLEPQPPADVAGNDWSPAAILATGLVAVAVLFGAGWALRRWSLRAGSRGRRRAGSARQELLAELERIRALGWHRDGRITDFYASSTDALRKFAASLDPGWSPSLTSLELLDRLRGRWNNGSTDSLAAAVRVAERAKFGRFQPGSDAAERDWQAIVQWVRELPDV